MKFIDFYRGFRLLLLSLALVACSTVSEKKADVLQTNNKDKATIKEHSNVVNVEPLLIQSNRYLNGKKSVSAAIRKSFDRALKDKRAGQLDEAEVVFTELTVREPSLSGPWVQLGDIAKERAQRALKQQQREHLLKKAAAQYHQALSINPYNYHGHNRLAMVYRLQGQFELALNHYEEAINSWPAFTAAYKNRGILYDLYIGDKTKALDNYQIYLALNNEKMKKEGDRVVGSSFVKQQRQIQDWIADLSRQIQQSKQKDQQQVEVVNNAL